MALAGSTMDMVNRSRQNRESMIHRRYRQARMREMYADAVNHRREQFAGEVIPAEEMAAIKQEIRETIRRDTRRNILQALAICVAIAALFFALLWFLI